MNALIEVIIIVSLQYNCAKENKMVAEEKCPSGTLRQTKEKR